MSSTSWQQRTPTYTPYLNTSNSSYGAWSATGLRSGRLDRKSLIPTSGKLSEGMTSSDVSRINITDAMSKYVSPYIASSQYDREKQRFGAEGVYSNASSTSGYDGSKKYNTLPSRYLTEDLGLYRSSTTIGEHNNQARYKDTESTFQESELSKISTYPRPELSKDPHGYKTSTSTADVMSSLNRSQSFHGFGSLRGNSTTNNHVGSSNYANASEPYDLMGSKRANGVPFTDITQDSQNLVSRALSDGMVPKPPSVPGHGNQDIGRENDRPWLHGVQSRSGQHSASQAKPFTPYRAGDYLFRNEPAEIPKRYNSIMGSVSRNSDVLEPSKDRNWYTNGHSDTDERPFESTYSKESSSYRSDAAVPEISNGYTVPTKSILKRTGRGTSALDLGPRRTVFGQPQSFSSSGRGLYSQSAHPLPSLAYTSSPASPRRASSSGKRVTFNMALNRSKHFVD